MYSFKNDYSEGAHQRILSALVESNLVQTEGYGLDPFTEAAANLLKEQIQCSNADIFFFSGGTQTNLTSISAFLRPHEAVISASTGHILVHETGAIEATGHKVISIEVSNGKLTAGMIQSACDFHTDEHMVKPRLVYISNPTEVGSIYNKSELELISKICRSNNLILYIDGARLGSALCSEENDLTLTDLGKLSDAFYIGGTKNGALLGEALVICKDALKDCFRFHMKQKGALLSKGRILGVQFFELFKDGLYFELARHSNQMAGLLNKGIKLIGFPFLSHSSTNQVFPILPNHIIEKLEEKYAFYVWSKVDENHSAIRLVTSWATEETTVTAFTEDLRRLAAK